MECSIRKSCHFADKRRPFGRYSSLAGSGHLSLAVVLVWKGLVQWVPQNMELDLVRVQQVRWESGCTEPAGEYTFFYAKGNDNMN
jgi:hypothetical protein